MDIFDITSSGADPGFQVRGDALKKNAPSGGRRENFWGISSEKSRFYAKKIKFFPILGGGRWFSPVSSTNKTDHHDITEILSRVALNTIILHYWQTQNEINIKIFTTIVLLTWVILVLSNIQHLLLISFKSINQSLIVKFSANGIHKNILTRKKLRCDVLYMLSITS